MNTRLAFFSCLFLFLAGLLSTSLLAQDVIHQLDEQQDGYVIPFAYDPPFVPVPIIQISINGAEPLPFVVDTGSSVALLIDNWAADKLKLKATGKTYNFANSSSKIVENTLSSVSIAATGTFKRADIPLQVAYSGDLHLPAEAFDHQHIAGIVGVGTLEAITARIDFVAKTLTLFVRPHPLLRFPEAAVLPLKAEDGLYFADVSLPQGLSSRLMVDTGSTLTTIPTSLEAHIQPVGVGVATQITMNGRFTYNKYLLEALQLGTFKEPKAVVSSKPATEVAKLGLNLLRRFRVTLDFPHKEMLLERATDYPQRLRVDGTTGIEIVQRNNKTYIRHVAPASPAEKADVQAEDCLLAIDGHNLTQFSAFIIDNLLQGYAATSVELTLQRAGAASRKVVFQRGQDFTPPRPPRFGFAIHRDPEQPMVVTGVDKGLPAEQAGLRIDDTILEINGVSTATITQEQMDIITKLPEWRLKVQRKGQPETVEIVVKSP